MIPDDEHARAIFGAAETLNGLILQARQAGLIVEIETNEPKREREFRTIPTRAVTVTVARRQEWTSAPRIGSRPPDVWTP